MGTPASGQLLVAVNTYVAVSSPRSLQCTKPADLYTHPHTPTHTVSGECVCWRGQGVEGSEGARTDHLRLPAGRALAHGACTLQRMRLWRSHHAAREHRTAQNNAWETERQAWAQRMGPASAVAQWGSLNGHSGATVPAHTFRSTAPAAQHGGGAHSLPSVLTATGTRSGISHSRQECRAEGTRSISVGGSRGAEELRPDQLPSARINQRHMHAPPASGSMLYVLVRIFGDHLRMWGGLLDEHGPLGLRAPGSQLGLHGWRMLHIYVAHGNTH